MNYEHQLRDHYLTVKARIARTEPPRKIIRQKPKPPPAKETDTEPEEDLSNLRERVHTLSIRQVIGLCARKHGLTYADILGHNRTQRYVAARQEAAWLLYQKDTMSKSVIAKHMNRQDHTSIVHLLRKYEDTYGLGENDKSAYEFYRPERTRAYAQKTSA